MGPLPISNSNTGNGLVITVAPGGTITVRQLDVQRIPKIQPLPPTKLVPAKNIPDGGYFRKKNGWMVYLRMSRGTSDFLELNPLHIYGVAHNGNVTSVSGVTEVVRMQHTDFLTCG